MFPLALLGLWGLAGAVGSDVYAYPPDTAWAVETGNGPCSRRTGFDYSTKEAACATVTNAEGLGYWTGYSCSPSYYGVSWTYSYTNQFGSCRGIGVQPPWPDNPEAQGGFAWLGPVCRNGGTLSGANCLCATGETDTGHSCISTPSDSDKNAGLVCPRAGNPISVSTGNKVLAETDYRASDITALEWRRIYNHLIYRSGGPVLSTRWTHSYSRWIVFAGTKAYLFKANGRVVKAQLINSAITNGEQTWTLDAYATDRLVRRFDTGSQPIGWRVINGTDHSSEIYDVGGRLVTVTSRSTDTQSLFYSDGTVAGGYVLDAQGNLTSTVLPAGLLVRIADSLGRQLTLGYDAQSRLIKFTNAGGGITRYAYAGGDLISVTHPDDRVRQYVYNEAAHTGGTNLPQAITGVIDEANHRLATYTYGALGRATSSKHWVDAAQTVPAGTASLVYNTDGAGLPTSSIVTNGLGTALSYSFTTVLGLVRDTGSSQPAGSGCGPASSSITYDAQANVSSRTDFNNNKICYAYDLSRNLETKRVEGLTSSAVCSTALSSPPTGSRLITTQWHPDWRLETRIAEPKKLTTITYNGQGATCAPSTVLVDSKPPAVMCTRTEQATTDETGTFGFAATTTGTARIWRYTYSAYGRVLTATDPNNRVTTTIYHPDNDADLGKRGNVASITNAANHITYITDYNPHGQPTRIVDPNGVVTVLTYDPRLRLTSRTVGNEATVFGYDPVGQMTSVNLPDGARLTYTYDAAHRLTAINDHKGNRIDYTLDAVGNRITEKTKDPGGVLVGNIARVIDALNRVQQVTGSVQ